MLVLVLLLALPVTVMISAYPVQEPSAEENGAHLAEIFEAEVAGGVAKVNIHAVTLHG